ncbi:MAG: hypothetical protein KTR14_01340 [Vampirovibrio sp.]|nr:hypothetical protein [Vampirovibrio sp.]
MITGYPDFKKRVWYWTLTLNTLVGLVLWWQYPYLLRAWVAGSVLGMFYLRSLFWSVDHAASSSIPRSVRRMQFAFSLTRIILFAYVIVMVAGFHVTETLVVICGCFSYKGILMIDYARHGLAAIRSFRQ